MLVDVTPKIIDTFFKYSLKYGKINQKTHEREPLAVRSVRSYKSILYAAFNQAAIDGLIKMNPVISISVHGNKAKNIVRNLFFLLRKKLLIYCISYPSIIPNY